MEKSTHIFMIIKYQKGSQFICLSVILIDSVFRTGKKYYPQVYFWRMYVVKEKKVIDNIKISSDSGRENSDEENVDEEDFDEENSDEES